MQAKKNALQGSLADTFTIVKGADGQETLAIVFKAADQQEHPLTEADFKNGDNVVSLLPADAQAKAAHMFRMAQICQGTLDTLGKVVAPQPFAMSVNQLLRWKL